MFKNALHMPLKQTEKEPELAKVETILANDPEILDAIRFLMLSVGHYSIETQDSFDVPEKGA